MHFNANEAHYLITGGAGFMGSAFIRFLLKQEGFQGQVSNLDLLTYAGNKQNVEEASRDSRYTFYHGDVRDSSLLETIFEDRPIDLIVHFAAETHVDRSISNPLPFIETNVLGTCALMEFVRLHPTIHFHHISTDEVYGALGKEGSFTEESPYCPNSPYSASKACSDHFVRAYGVTYGLYTTISHASNNYGPGQYPEKLIPLIIQHALEKKPLPLYGSGENIREWTYVDDHSRAIGAIINKGNRGEVYNIGGGHACSNLELVHLLLGVIEEVTGEKDLKDLITFVPDRPGHDFRYAMDGAKLQQLGYRPIWPLRAGLSETVRSYLKVLA